MLPYSPPAVRAPLPPRALGQKELSQTFDQLLHFSPALGDAIRLAFHGGTTYLGIHVGLHERGFLSALGWFLGIGNGIGAVCDAISLAKRAAGTHPEGPCG